jgi:hypothetical protein
VQKLLPRCYHSPPHQGELGRPSPARIPSSTAGVRFAWVVLVTLRIVEALRRLTACLKWESLFRAKFHTRLLRSRA